MVDFSDSDERRRWFAAQTNDVAAVFAARAALRIVPTISLASGASGSRLSRRKIILQVFRAVASAWTTAAYPGVRNELSRAARAALRGTAEIKALLPESAAIYAAAAAATGAIDADPPDYAITAVSYAVDAAGISHEAFDAMLASLAADASLLGQRFSSVTLANSQLWPKRTPDWAQESWLHLKTALLEANENWIVWTDWYEERLRGRATDQALEVARVTLPADAWDQGPGVVNGLIRAMFEERGIWRHAIADEAERMPPAIPPEVPQATGDYNLESRLTVLSVEKLKVISARLALRAIPLLGLSHRDADNSEFGAACLSAFGGAAAAWHAARYPAHRDISALFQPASSIFPSGNYEDDLGIIIAGTIVSATDVSASPWAIAGCIDRIRTIANREDGAASAATFQMALSDDLRDVNDVPAPAIAAISLWPGGSSPPWITNRWERLRRDLIRVGLGWETWVDWYENRLRGDAWSEAHELIYVEVPDEFWPDGPARVNTWIQRRLEPASSSQSPDFLASPNILAEPDFLQIGADAKLPTVPTQQPAAIEPVWRNRRLTLAKTPAKSDLTRRKFTSALKSLRREMQAFAIDLATDANIDKRFAGYVSHLGEEIPEKAPRQDELFRLGHAESVFSGYAATVNDEWPPILAARYHAISLNFDRTLRQSPLWREFKRNAAKDILTTDQIRSALPLAAEVADVLRTEDGANLIDPAIPETLDQVAEPLRTSLSARDAPSVDIIESGKELLAYDIVESVNNIFKAIFQAAISAGIWTTAKDAGAAFLTEAHKSVIKEAGRLGKKVGPGLTKWARRLAIGGGAYHIAGKPLIDWLVTNYPEIFKWLEPVAHFFSSL